MAAFNFKVKQPGKEPFVVQVGPAANPLGAKAALERQTHWPDGTTFEYVDPNPPQSAPVVSAVAIASPVVAPTPIPEASHE